MLYNIDVNQKEIVLMWVHGMLVAEEMRLLTVLLKKLSTKNLQTISCPFQTVKRLTAKYMPLDCHMYESSLAKRMR